MQMTSPHQAQLVPSQNRLLRSLSRDAKARIIPNMENVSLKQGQVIFQAGDTERFVYFPNDCLLSLLYVLENGKSTEIAVVGSDGFVGSDALLGEGTSWSQALVQNAGTAYRIPASVLRQEFYQNSELQTVVLLYIQSAMIQTALVAACNPHYSIAQQLCCKLLFSLDRLGGDELTLTQEAIANALGVRRESVTDAANLLREQGAIDYCRGHIRVLDRTRLEELSSECYSVVTAESDRLMPWQVSPAANSSHG